MRGHPRSRAQYAIDLTLPAEIREIRVLTQEVLGLLSTALFYTAQLLQRRHHGRLDCGMVRVLRGRMRSASFSISC